MIERFLGRAAELCVLGFLVFLILYGLAEMIVPSLSGWVAMAGGYLMVAAAAIIIGLAFYKAHVEPYVRRFSRRHKGSTDTGGE